MIWIWPPFGVGGIVFVIKYISRPYNHAGPRSTASSSVASRDEQRLFV